MQDCHESCPHAGKFRRLTGLLEDGLVSSLDGGVEPSLRPRGRASVGSGRREMGEEGIDGEMTGNFTTSGSAHAITDDEGPGCGRGGASILIAAANLTAVGEHGVDEFAGSQSIEYENLVRRKQYTLQRRRPRVR